MWAHFLLALIISIAYVVEAVKGHRSLIYVLIACVIAMSPVIAEFYFYYGKSHETTMVRHCVGIGFAIFYTFVIFTVNTNLVFTYVIPMILVVSVYCDARYTLLVGMGALLENIIMVVIGVKTGGLGYAGSTAAEIQIILMILVLLYAMGMTITIKDNDALKVKIGRAHV